MHDGAVHGSHIDQAQVAQHQLARLQHLVQQVLCLEPVQHQVDQAQRAQSMEVAQKSLQFGEQLAASAEQFDAVRVVGRAHVAREDVIQGGDAAANFLHLPARVGFAALWRHAKVEKHREDTKIQLTSLFMVMNIN